MVAQIQSTPIDEGARPYGGLAGMMAGNEFVDRQVANEQAIHQANLENAIKEVEARRAQADYSNPQMEQWRQQGIMGKNMSDYSKGKLEYGTLDSNIKTKLSENLAKASAADIDTMINGLDQFTSMASSGNPLAMHQALSSLPPQYQKIVQQLEAQEPGSSVKYAQQLSDTIKEARKNTPAHLGKIEEENVKGENTEITHQGDRESHEKIGAANNAASISVARINAESRLAVANARNKAQDILSQVQAGKLGYEKAATAFEIMSSMSTEPEEKKRYAEMAAQFSVADQKSKAAGRQIPVDLSAMGIKTQQATSTLGTGGTPQARPPLSSFNK